MNKLLTKIVGVALGATMAVGVGVAAVKASDGAMQRAEAATTYTQLTSIASIDQTADYVLGIDGTGFHYEGTSSWGKTALPASQTPLYYRLQKAGDGTSFTAKTTIGETVYYLQVPTSNTFSMATSTGTNTDLIIGTTQVQDTNYAVANKTTTARHLRINGTSGLRSYAGTTGSMAFFYKVVNTATPEINIDSDSKTTIVGSSTRVGITYSNLTAALTASSGNTSIATVTLTDNGDDTAYVDIVGVSGGETTVTIASSGATSKVINVTVYAADDDDEITFSKYGLSTTSIDGVCINRPNFSLTFDKNGGTNAPIYHSGDAHIRTYAGNTLTFASNSTTELKKITFTYSGSYNGNLSANVGSVSNGVWTGKSTSVVLTVGSGTQGRFIHVEVEFDSGSTDPCVNSVTVSPDTLTLFTSEGSTSDTLTATVDAEYGASEAVTWSSSNDSIATVNQSGVVTAVAEGTATITATSDFDGTKSGTCTVKVYDRDGENEVTFKKLGYTNEQAVTLVEKTNFDILFDEGTKYYTTGEAVRVYGGKTMMVSSNTGSNFATIKLSFGSGDGSNTILVDEGTYDSETKTWSGDASDVIFTIDGTTGHRRIAKVEVTFQAASSVSITEITEHFAESKTTLAVGDTNSYLEVEFTSDNGEPSVTAVSSDTAVIATSISASDIDYDSSEKYGLAVVHLSAEAVGSATITITVTYGTDFDSETTRAISVTANYSLVDHYERVLDDSEIEDGRYLIVYEDETDLVDDLMFDGSLETLDAVRNNAAVTIDDSLYILATSSTESKEFTIAAKEGGYSIKSSSNLYIGQTSDGNGLKTSSNDDYVNAISIDADGYADIASSGAHLRYNSASDQDRFRYYKSASYANQQPIELFKFVSAEEPLPTAVQEFIDDFFDLLVKGENHACKADGSSDIEDLQAAWELLAGEFDLLTSEEQALFTDGQADEDGDELGQVLALYDYIGKKYNTRLQTETLTDYNFMSRSSANASNSINPINKVNNTVAIVVVVTISLVSVSALGAYFLLRKKKEER